MTYRIRGLDPAPFKPLFGLTDEKLAESGIVRMTVDSPTFPCRVSLTDRAIGEKVLLLNHVSHDVANPYRATHAIFLSLRGFDADGMMAEAILTQPGEADEGIRRLFANPDVATIHAHNATRGCFAARIERN